MSNPIDEALKARSRPEDVAHENGGYLNTCHYCQQRFMGHKRRVVCKVCNSIPSELETLRAENAMLKENNDLSEVGQALSELVWRHSKEGDDAYEVEDLLESHYADLARVTQERDEADKREHDAVYKGRHLHSQLAAAIYQCDNRIAEVCSLQALLAAANEARVKAEEDVRRLTEQNDLTWKAVTAVRDERDEALAERDSLRAKLQQAKYEKELAIKEANRRDDKWKAGLDEIFGPNEWDAPLANPSSNTPERKWRAMKAERDAALAACKVKGDALCELEDSLKICFADSHAIRVEWLREQGLETVAKVVENIRRHSGAKRGLVLAALSTDPATALLESKAPDGSISTINPARVQTDEFPTDTKFKFEHETELLIPITFIVRVQNNGEHEIDAITKNQKMWNAASEKERRVIEDEIKAEVVKRNSL